MDAENTHMNAGRLCSGFSMMELIVVLIVIGILAVTVTPRFFETSAFETVGFTKQVQGVIQYGQKLATTQRASVYVQLDDTADSVALCYANSFPCPANEQVVGPYGEPAYGAQAPGDVSLETAATFYFDAQGRPYQASDTIPDSTFSTLTIKIVGGGDSRDIVVEQESGYVRS
jgi:prepilin-type N-terminal cleavage/methylation domain-containing protein